MTDNQQAAREWLPISEAPKDGRWVLVYDEEYGGMEVARWDNEYINPFSHERGAWFDSEWKCAATHWQPLPAPPHHTQEIGIQ